MGTYSSAIIHRLVCGGFFSVSGLLCSGLLLSRRGTRESLALGFMMQFLIVFSVFLGGFGYGNAFS